MVSLHVSKRPGFTITELLVAIGIVGMIMSLILMAVQRVRSSAARAACLDQLRQVGAGLHLYHQANGSFPKGCSSPGKDEPFPYMSWHTRLLPYIEQDAAWSRATAAYKQTPDFFQSPPHLFAEPMKLYSCPNDPMTGRTWTVQEPVGFTSYLGNAGRNLFREDGVLFLNSAIRISDVTDGTSNTLAAGERPPSSDGLFGWWYAAHGQANSGSADMVIGCREMNVTSTRMNCPPGPYHFEAGHSANPCDVFHYWSQHPGGANFLWCDGSARFLTYAADDILLQLSTRAGGETIEGL